MKRSELKIFLLMGTLLLLSSCFAPETPQEVAKAFWSSVIKNDASGAAEYSTLAGPEDYDAFSRNWHGLQPSWGRVVLDDRQASIETRLADPSAASQDGREFVTYLVRQGGYWKVDYDRTRREVHGGPLGELMGKLSQLGNDLSRQYESSLKDFQLEMERLGSKLEEMADTISQQAAQSVERYADELQRSIDQLRESINRALREQDKHMSDQDRRVLTEVSADLERNSSSLTQPDVTSVAESSRNMGRAQHKLDSIKSDWSTEYRTQWHELSSRLERDMQSMLEEISAAQPNSH